MIYPLVRDLAADGIPVTVTCRVLGFSTQALLQVAEPTRSRSGTGPTRTWSTPPSTIHADDPAFGYRFIADELAAEHGITASENRVARLCSSARHLSRCSHRKRGRRPKPGPAGPR